MLIAEIFIPNRKMEDIWFDHCMSTSIDKENFKWASKLDKKSSNCWIKQSRSISIADPKLSLKYEVSPNCIC